MIIIKTEQQINDLREGGKRLAQILDLVAKSVRPGITTEDLDAIAYNEIIKMGDEPAFLNYRPEGALSPFPKTLCTSVNNQIVHGIPSKNVVLKEGDIVSIDLGIKHKGLFTDHAVTVSVGDVSKEIHSLLHVAEQALYKGIEMAKNGNNVGDISYAIESFARAHGYGIVRELAGHGVGVKIHEDPYIPNYGKPGTGARLRPGMVIAIEPMITLGRADILTEDDNWTISTVDDSVSAHFEHTILITENEPEILTFFK